MDLAQSLYDSCYVNKKKDNEDAIDFSLSFKLIDSIGNLLVESPNEFYHELLCMKDEKIKVVSIFGNPGAGKSETLNKTFFSGQRVFQESAEQSFGVYAAKCNKHGVICLDTKGLSDQFSSTWRMEMLVKILAISDIVIYRTRAEGSYNEMINFLETASKAYSTHLSKVLFQYFNTPGTIKQKGPDVIVVHEPDIIKPTEIKFSEFCDDVNAFHTITYIAALRTPNNNMFNKLEELVEKRINYVKIRSARKASVVFKLLRSLHLHFSTEAIDTPIKWFPEQYFSCQEHCKSCGKVCELYIGHISHGLSHVSSDICEYKEHFGNKETLCKRCFDKGKQVKVKIEAGLVQYALNMSVIECPNCGEIYRTWKYWSNNKTLEEEAILHEALHVWKEDLAVATSPSYTGQGVIDGASNIGGAISNITARTLKAFSDIVTDTVAPNYWKPNHTIKDCTNCQRDFEKSGLLKHHCRGCGEGVCSACSQKKVPVPGRGWTSPVRVCNDCYEGLLMGEEHLVSEPTSDNKTDVRMRKYGENVLNTVTCTTTLAKETIKDFARPLYWVPNAKSPNCKICKERFGTAEELDIAKLNRRSYKVPSSNTLKTVNESHADCCRRHHCRRCGEAVCKACSRARLPVPELGWKNKVRVCDTCAQLITD